jgi:diketogulonate reductase-like aldo/keto reductase
MRGWTDVLVEQMKAMADRGDYATDIAIAMNTSKLSVLNVCARRGITINAHTPAEQAEMDEKTRERERRKNIRRRFDARVPVAVRFCGVSRTSPIFRNQLPRLVGNPTRSQLEAELRQAVINTGGRL